ncbi:MAG: ester cyclase [Deltaproteobacteria bacterium]|nr:ester cyclase [Deltaproteobacteria bacterium]
MPAKLTVGEHMPHESSLHARTLPSIELPASTSEAAEMKLFFVVALVMSASTPAQEPKMIPSEQNKAVVRKVFEEGVNRGKFEVIERLIADDYVGANSGAAVKGPPAFIKPLMALHEAFPDIQYKFDDVIAEGDKVAVHWHWTGTHQGTFHGPAGVFAPTGKLVTNEGMAIFEVKGGKVSRAVLLTDRLSFLQDMGAVPKAPAPPSAR